MAKNENVTTVRRYIVSKMSSKRLTDIARDLGMSKLKRSDIMDDRTPVELDEKGKPVTVGTGEGAKILKKPEKSRLTSSDQNKEGSGDSNEQRLI